MMLSHESFFFFLIIETSFRWDVDVKINAEKIDCN